MNNKETVKKNKLQLFYTIFGWIFTVYFALIAILNIVILSQSIFSKSRPKLFGDYYVVATNNDMRGDVNKGDLAFLKDIKQSDLKIGDIIEVNINGVTELTKVVSLENNKVGTKQNNTEEIYILESADVISGVLDSKITIIGKFALFSQSVWGIIIFLVIPLLTLVVYIVYEIVRKQKSKKLNAKTNASQNAGIESVNKNVSTKKRQLKDTDK